MWTAGTATATGVCIFEAMADGSFSTANAFPFAAACNPGNNAVSGATFVWSWWYSPSSVWVSFTSPAWILRQVSGVTPIFVAGPGVCGVNPWDTQDQAIPVFFGRDTGLSQPGFLGFSKTLKMRLVGRAYPDTVNLATDAYVYLGDMLIPWPETIAPI